MKKLLELNFLKSVALIVGMHFSLVLFGQVSICESFIAENKKITTNSYSLKRIQKWEKSLIQKQITDTSIVGLFPGIYEICNLPDINNCNCVEGFNASNKIELYKNGEFLYTDLLYELYETGFWEFETGRLILKMDDSIRIGATPIYATEIYYEIAIVDKSGFIIYSSYPKNKKWFHFRLQYYLKYNVAIRN